MRALIRTALLCCCLTLLKPALTPAQQQPTAADLFNNQTLQRIELQLNSSDWEKLKQNFQENDHYPAAVVWNGQIVRNVGIRSRGLGSRSGSKPHLRVDIDHYPGSKDRRWLGLKTFNLDNLVQDASAIRETTAMQFLQRLGIPAPREAHAQLYINGRYAGLYAIVEFVDKPFLARIFGEIDGDVQNDGYLFDYEWLDEWRFNYLGSTLEPYKARFAAETNKDKTQEKIWRPIEELVRLVNDLPSDRFMNEIQPRLDLRQFVRYVAIQNFMSQNDGFLGAWGINNFYFYRKENSDQHVLIPWDEDNAFISPEYDLRARHEENVLFRKAMEVRELNDLYYETLREAAEMADARPEGSEVGWLEGEIRRQLDLVYEPLAVDQYRIPHYSMAEHESHRNALIDFARERSRIVRLGLPR